MLQTNPFSILAETVAPIAMQSFIIAMILLIAFGTIVQMIHHKNLTYFFNNAKKAKLSATKKLGIGEKTSIIAKTAVVDIGTTLSVNIFLASAPDLERIPNLASLDIVAWLTSSAEDMKENPLRLFLR